ncbi:MAG TPA: arginine deiminase family protein [Thermomicrobiales bacterium]|jgi:N-dimethylarginine dimethylaminohydrolase|nr:arginine deiminase [Chloroflexota bacterium]HBY46677.1 arginine deiminase [Chloroflexota bacterium]HQX62745.1 arginine deiminase family protein [Thermomicrobiales bacterium]HQZ89142.1 arginine deiminase family protein [Thermomicrobiales bacterium]HRA32171.1 arginine deiminase family protein [Thermomicrobiales bacterium]
MSDRSWGGNTMSGKLERVLVYPPVPPDPSVSWEEFGYLHPLDHDLAVREHTAFRRILTDAGIEVITGEIDDAKLQDGIFGYDPVFTTNAGAILTRMGKPLREAEVDLAERTMQEIGVPIAGRIVAPGTVEGGDCLFIDANTLAIGRGYRTNESGIQQMREILASSGVEVIGYDLPYWHGAGECLHLLSMISMIDDDLAIVYKPLMSVALVQLLEERGITMVEIPDEEFPTQGCNVLALGPRRCVILRENTVTAERLRAAGCEVITYAGDEISHNRTGGPTCLTRPILRLER